MTSFMCLRHQLHPSIVRVSLCWWQLRAQRQPAPGAKRFDTLVFGTDDPAPRIALFFGPFASPLLTECSEFSFQRQLRVLIVRFYVCALP